MALIIGGASGALLRLKCPACGQVQARERLAHGSEYACEKCSQPFRREAGELEAGELEAGDPASDDP